MDFEKAINLRNEASEILWNKLQMPTPFVASDREGRELNSIPALGVRHREQQDYQIAIYVAEERDQEIFKSILAKVPEEKIDFQVTGPVIPYDCSVSMGSAISRVDQQYKIGTLGCFVKKRGHSELFILSNNHVLANLNKGQREQDAIILHQVIAQEQKYLQLDKPDNFLVQISRFFQKISSIFVHKPISSPFSEKDKNESEKNNNSVVEIATLTHFIELKTNSINLVDAAIAKIKDPALVTGHEIKGVGKLKGYYELEDIPKLPSELMVTKIGQKTGQTWGKFRSFEMKFFLPYEQLGRCEFTNIITIEGLKDQPFSRPGDSGSLIVDQNGYALALLLAGTEIGGTNGRGITYAIPISTVLKELDVELVLT